MKTSIFVIILIIVVFMAGALILNIAYQKRNEKQKAPTTLSEPFAAIPTIFAISYTGAAAEVQSPIFKPIVMDHDLSNKHPY